MNNEWHEGTDGLAEFLVQDSSRRADVVLEDGQDGHASWDRDKLQVLVYVELGYHLPYSEFCRRIKSWRPKREPLVLTGRVQPTSVWDRVRIPLPPNTPKDTWFTYTLTEEL